jgi:hypothetical protein
MFDTGVVRGLDYYTRTAFEFTHGALGAQNAILGGGRYDGLSEMLGGPAAPGIGFAIGEDRLVLALSESAEAVVRKPDVYVAALGAGMNKEAARLARELRRHDVVVELGDESFRLKKSFEAATKAGAKYILIVGENEVKADAFAVKNLATGGQVSVPRGELAGIQGRDCCLSVVDSRWVRFVSSQIPTLSQILKVGRNAGIRRVIIKGARMKYRFVVFTILLCCTVSARRLVKQNCGRNADALQRR